MNEEHARRKLTAILSTDVEGYSRLMADDEEATVRTITSYREFMISIIQAQNGRVADAKGDNILAEFASVVDAVRCAVEIQRDLAERNAELAYERRMEFRIGVNLGDVIDEDGRIYGESPGAVESWRVQQDPAPATKKHPYRLRSIESSFWFR